MRAVEAHFSPQWWIGDHAMDVDPLGPQTWDATEAFYDPTLDEGYRTELAAEIMERGVALDHMDWFQDAPGAPEWVRSWQGPFSLTLHFTS